MAAVEWEGFVRFKCVACKKWNKVPASMSGRRARCSCGADMLVPQGAPVSGGAQSEEPPVRVSRNLRRLIETLGERAKNGDLAAAREIVDRLETCQANQHKPGEKYESAADSAAPPIEPAAEAPPHDQTKALEERVEALERKLDAMEDEVRTRHVVIVDEAGRERVHVRMDFLGHPEVVLDGRTKLGASFGEAGLFLYDGNRKARACLYLISDNPVLEMHDENGESRVRLDLGKYGPSFDMADGEGATRASLGVFPFGPMLVFSDERGSQRVGLYALSDESRLAFYDENGQARAEFQVGEDGPSADLLDEKGNTRATMRVVQLQARQASWVEQDIASAPGLNVAKEGPIMGFVDAEGNLRLALILNQGEPKAAILGKDGQTAWSAP